MTPEEANVRNQALVTTLIEQRNIAQNTAAEAIADLQVAKALLQASQTRIAELEAQLAATEN